MKGTDYFYDCPPRVYFAKTLKKYENNDDHRYSAIHAWGSAVC